MIAQLVDKITSFTPNKARRFYDMVGHRYDWVDIGESNAKARGLELLEAIPGQSVLNVGCGTGKDHLRLSKSVFPGGSATAIDLSFVMARLTKDRCDSPVVQANISNLPFPCETFDRIFSSYLFDLVIPDQIVDALEELKRVLRPDGRIVIVTLFDGINIPSNLLIRIWKKVYSVSPVICGGCRPIRMENLVTKLEFKEVYWETVTQFSIPSGIVVLEN